jgi:hypothetical protein
MSLFLITINKNINEYETECFTIFALSKPALHENKKGREAVSASQPSDHRVEVTLVSRSSFQMWHQYWLIPGSGLESD